VSLLISGIAHSERLVLFQQQQQQQQQTENVEKQITHYFTKLYLLPYCESGGRKTVVDSTLTGMLRHVH
jgi:hypothetical protein